LAPSASPANTQGSSRKSLFVALTERHVHSTLVLSIAVFIIAPQQLPVSIYKLNLIALAAVAGYWIDRSVFPYARPQLDALRALDRSDDDEPARFTDEVAEEGESCMLVQMPDAAPLYFMLGCMLRRALIISAAILAVSLGA